MSETQFAMVSDWMVNGNINDFVKTHLKVDRLGLRRFSIQSLVVVPSLTIAQPSSWGVSLKG